MAVSVCTTCISGAKVLGGAIEALRSELPTLPGAGCVDFRIGGLEVDGELADERRGKKS